MRDGMSAPCASRTRAASYLGENSLMPNRVIIASKSWAVRVSAAIGVVPSARRESLQALPATIIRATAAARGMVCAEKHLVCKPRSLLRLGCVIADELYSVRPAWAAPMDSLREVYPNRSRGRRAPIQFSPSRRRRRGGRIIWRANDVLASPDEVDVPNGLFALL